MTTTAEQLETVLETERLRLKKLEAKDAEFILRLLNEPSFLRYIGDKKVRTIEDAARYIENGPRASYERFGFGLFLVELKATGKSIGMCGLLKRDTLPDVDIGFAFLPEYWSQGYALEAAFATLKDGREHFGLQRIVAITSLDNNASIRLLEKLGFTYEGLTKLGDDQSEVKLFGTDIQILEEQ